MTLDIIKKTKIYIDDIERDNLIYIEYSDKK